MKNLLEKYLQKIGVVKYEELTSEEKDTYRQWEAALVGRKLTDSDIASFLSIELDTAVSRLTDVDLKMEDAIFRKVEVRFIKKIINLLNMPAMEKQLLERQIESKL